MYDPESTLSSYLGAVVNVFDNEFEDYWGISHKECPKEFTKEEWETAKTIRAIAKSFLRSARTMNSVTDKGVKVAELFEVVDQEWLTQNKLFRDSIELDIAWEFEETLPRMTDKAIQMLNYVVDAGEPRTRSYLMRVADCFIRGMETETIIMCGAALEAALDDYLPTEQVILDRLKIIHRNRVFLGDRIRYLGEVLRLTPDVVEKAFAVSEARNNAVHLHIDATPTADESLGNLAYVLRQLESVET